MQLLEPKPPHKAPPSVDFRRLFEAVPGLYLVLTPRFKIAAVSDAYLRATLTQRDEILGRDIFDVFPDNPSQPDATGVCNLRASLERVVAQRVSDSMAVQKYDIRRPAAEGGGYEERFWNPINSPVLDAHGEVAYIIHRVDDVTDFVRLKLRRIEQDTLTQDLLTRGEQLEAEVFQRAQEIQEANKRLRETNEALTELHAGLERRVAKRTTELAQVNETLQSEVFERRRNEVLLQSVLNNTFDAIICISERGEIETFNDAAERMFGYASSEVMGKNVNLLMPEPHHSRHDGYLDNYLRTGVAKIIGTEREMTARRKDGSIFPVDLTVTECTTGEGERRHFVGVIRDITQRKLAEEHQARLVAVLEATPDLVGLADANLRPMFMNQAGKAMLGVGADDDFTRSRISDFYSPRWFKVLETDGIPSAIKRGTWIGETALRTKDGREIPVSQVIVAHKTAEGEVRFLSTIIRDLTEQKKLESQLRQSQKLEAFGQLAGGVAHDFNNLLTVINGYCECLGDVVALNDDGREMVQEIRNAGDRAAGLTRQLLAFSRRQVLQPKVLNLNEVIRDTGKMLDRLIGEDVELTTVLCSTLWPVKVDAGQVEQVLMNLAVNARDAMPDGGKITIESTNVELDESYSAAHLDIAPGRYVVIAVSDTGCGMDEKTKSRIFEPFFTTKEPGKGTGLGLATVFGIVKQSGGHIAVYSEPGSGTTFRIFLPKVEPVSEPRTEDKAHRPLARGTETVLVVEDADLVRNLACRILRSQGYNVLEANTGREALAICDTHPGTIHLVLTDVVMPEMNGRQLAEQLRHGKRPLKVLFMSGYTDDAVVRHGLLEADTNFLQKPFSPTTLTQKVRGILDE